LTELSFTFCFLSRSLALSACLVNFCSLLPPLLLLLLPLLLHLLLPDLVLVQQSLSHLFEGHQVSLILVRDSGRHNVLNDQPVSPVPGVPLPAHLPLLLPPLLVSLLLHPSHVRPLLLRPPAHPHQHPLLAGREIAVGNLLLRNIFFARLSHHFHILIFTVVLSVGVFTILSPFFLCISVLCFYGERSANSSHRINRICPRHLPLSHLGLPVIVVDSVGGVARCSPLGSQHCLQGGGKRGSRVKWRSIRRRLYTLVKSTIAHLRHIVFSEAIVCC